MGGDAWRRYWQTNQFTTCFQKPKNTKTTSKTVHGSLLKQNPANWRCPLGLTESGGFPLSYLNKDQPLEFSSQHVQTSPLSWDGSKTIYPKRLWTFEASSNAWRVLQANYLIPLGLLWLDFLWETSCMLLGSSRDVFHSTYFLSWNCEKQTRWPLLTILTAHYLLRKPWLPPPAFPRASKHDHDIRFGALSQLLGVSAGTRFAHPFLIISSRWSSIYHCSAPTPFLHITTTMCLTLTHGLQLHEKKKQSSVIHHITANDQCSSMGRNQPRHHTPSPSTRKARQTSIHFAAFLKVVWRDWFIVYGDFQLVVGVPLHRWMVDLVDFMKNPINGWYVDKTVINQAP